MLKDVWLIYQQQDLEDSVFAYSMFRRYYILLMNKIM